MPRTASTVSPVLVPKDLRRSTARIIDSGFDSGAAVVTWTDPSPGGRQEHPVIPLLLPDPRARSQGRASYTLLNGVSAARRNRVKPASVTTWRIAASPAWAPSA